MSKAAEMGTAVASGREGERARRRELPIADAVDDASLTPIWLMTNVKRDPCSVNMQYAHVCVYLQQCLIRFNP